MIMGIKPKVIFFMGFVAVALPSVGFILASYFTLERTVALIHANHSHETLTFLRSLDIEQNDTNVLRETIRAYLDYDTLNNRQGRANSALASRTWLRFISSGFGGVLIFMGAVFVLARIETRLDSSLGAEEKMAGIAISIRSTSPGIFMILIGAVLMAVPLFAKQTIWTFDNDPHTTPATSQLQQVHDRVTPENEERLRNIRENKLSENQ